MNQRHGLREFTKLYGVQIPYVVGSMYRGISSIDLVSACAQNGILSFFGAGGLSVPQVRRSLQELSHRLGMRPWGVNLMPRKQDSIRYADAILGSSAFCIEVSGYVVCDAALAYLRAKSIQHEHLHVRRFIGKVSRLDTARTLLSPPPRQVLDGLVKQQLLTRDEALVAAEHRLVDDIVIEADSGGHTDSASAISTWPRLKSFCISQCPGTSRAPLVGYAGGIGAPPAVAAAFLLGADFVLTGSVNQCTVEAALSAQAKSMLQVADVRDVAYAPAGDALNTESLIQVLRKGSLFSMRARNLRDLALKYETLSRLPDKVRHALNQDYFRTHPINAEPETSDSENKVPDPDLPSLFKRYFYDSHRSAQQGISTEIDNFQIQCSAAMGAFNAWYGESALREWHKRHIAEVSFRLLEDGLSWLRTAGFSKALTEQEF